ncbi:RNA-binding protein 39-like isoform X1 [Camellia sinensis]|uniref:RNA-binding protein 39-like isoform X1 n=2 Tax=Camellia sinensis TaxID=4442 RepID=UPI001036C078|nr:RNA-binding protein 39-like isoform X1 [Camellia sinensis]
MEFDEYDYLEKTVEEGKRDSSSTKKSQKGYRRRERSVEEDSSHEEEEHRRSKKSRGEEENGSQRERSIRDAAEKDVERDKDRRRTSRNGDRGSERERLRDRDRERDRGSREKDRERERGSREKDKERERDKRDKEKERERARDRERREKDKEREREMRDREKEKEKEIELHQRSRSRSRSSRRHDSDRERDKEYLRDRETELELRDSRRLKEKKEAVEPEADPERDQRTVFAYQMPLKATERDVYEFFSKAGKVRDVRLIMDRNSRRSKGVGYIEFYDAMSVPMAIALSGHLLFGQPVMVKPSEAEKNLVQTNASGGGSVVGSYGAVDRKLYVGNLHFNMTEFQLKQIFEAFGPVELVQLPTDPETGHCKGFGFIQFAQLEHAKAAQSLNGKLEIAGRIIKVSSVTDHVGVQDSGAKAADFDDDDGGGLSLNAQSRALLMQKLDRSGTATSVAGSLGVPVLNGATSNQQAITLPIDGQSAVLAPALPALVTSLASEPIGKPSECLLLKNMFDPATETEPDFDLDITEDVQEECSNYGRVKHIYVDKNSAGYVYLRFETVEAAAIAQRAMHNRWFARRLISAVFLQPYEYDAKFKDAV